MTTISTEREALMARLADMVSARFVARYRKAPMEDLRSVVADCEESLRIYAELGLVDESRQTPPPQGKAA